MDNIFDVAVSPSHFAAASTNFSSAQQPIRNARRRGGRGTNKIAGPFLFEQPIWGGEYSLRSSGEGQMSYESETANRYRQHAATVRSLAAGFKTSACLCPHTVEMLLGVARDYERMAKLFDDRERKNWHFQRRSEERR